MTNATEADQLLEKELKSWLVKTKKAPINSEVEDFIELAAPGLNLLSANRIAAFVYDYVKGGYFFINDYFVELMGRTRDRILRDGIQTMQELVHPEDFPKCLELTHRVIGVFNNMKAKEKESLHVRYFFRMKRKSGEYAWIMQTNRITVWNEKRPPLDVGYLVELFDSSHPLRVMGILETASRTEHFFPVGEEPILERLSGRQLEILNLIKLGLTSKEIAVKLSLTEATVRSHRKHIMKKLDAKSMVQAITILDQNKQLIRSEGTPADSSELSE